MSGISHLFRKQPPKQPPKPRPSVVLEADILLESVSALPEGPGGSAAIVIETAFAPHAAVHLCPGEKIHLTLTEIQS